MNRRNMDFKMLWIMVLLIYTKVSGGEFYDPSNGASSSILDDSGGGITVLGSESEGANRDLSAPSVKGLGRAEVSFIAKLRQRQRQRALLPAVVIPSAEQPFTELPTAVLADNAPGGTFGDDIETVVRFLEQQGRTGSVGSGEQFSANGQKRAAALRSTMARRSHSFPTGSKDRFAPSISVGALTNLGDFFQNLKLNLESLETRNLSNDQFKLLDGQNMIANLRKEFTEDYSKPAGSAAFLHAIRNYRPSNRIRALVSSVPDLYRGTNFHDPVYKLAGLGK